MLSLSLDYCLLSYFFESQIFLLIAKECPQFKPTPPNDFRNYKSIERESRWNPTETILENIPFKNILY